MIVVKGPENEMMKITEELYKTTENIDQVTNTESL